MAIGDELKRLGKTGCLHIDIEDGNFIPNITFGLKTVRALAAYTDTPLDVHLLVANPYEYIVPLAQCGIKGVAIHYEVVGYPLLILETIRSNGMRAGLALNFKTCPDAIAPFTEGLDYVIVMTAEPDGLGQRFRPGMLAKISSLRRMLPAHVSIWADGGIGIAELPDVLHAGADTAVIGRAIWENPDPAAAYREFAAVQSA